MLYSLPNSSQNVYDKSFMDEGIQVSPETKSIYNGVALSMTDVSALKELEVLLQVLETFQTLKNWMCDGTSYLLCLSGFNDLSSGDVLCTHSDRYFLIDSYAICTSYVCVVRTRDNKRMRSLFL